MNQSINKAIDEANKLAIENPDVLVSLYKLDNHCLYASPSHEEITGYTSSDMVGHHWAEFVVKSDRAHGDLAGNDALLNGESVEFGVRIAHKAGGTVNVRGTVRLIHDSEGQDSYLLFQASVVPD